MSNESLNLEAFKKAIDDRGWWLSPILGVHISSYQSSRFYMKFVEGRSEIDYEKTLEHATRKARTYGHAERTD